MALEVPFSDSYLTVISVMYIVKLIQMLRYGEGSITKPLMT